MLAFSLPAGIGPQALRHFLISVGLLSIVAAILTVRFVANLALRAWLAAALVCLDFVLFVERADLANCAQTCSCQVFRLSVQVPGCQPQ